MFGFQVNSRVLPKENETKQKYVFSIVVGKQYLNEQYSVAISSAFLH